MSTRPDDSPAAGDGAFGFGPANYAVIAAGLVAIVAGYVLLDGGSVTAAPVLLVLGYAIFLPAGILIGWRALEDRADWGAEDQ